MIPFKAFAVTSGRMGIVGGGPDVAALTPQSSGLRQQMAPCSCWPSCAAVRRAWRTIPGCWHLMVPDSTKK